MHQQQPGRALNALETFLATPLDVTLTRHHAAGAIEQQLLALAQSVAAGVPAYQALLAEQQIDPATINGLEAYAALPIVTKQNYLQQHPLPALCRDGQIDACDFVAVSSGSTGSPTLWPRSLADELQIATRFEQVLHDSFQADQRSTLAVVCFTLGTWVGGMFTAACCRYVGSKGYPITVVTPGNNREEIFRVVQQLAPYYEQVVLLGYPPALKDIIDAGRARGVDWPSYRVKLVMAGEVFSEEWRALVGERLGSQDVCYDSAALYGTADAGVLANETPLSICIRRFLAAHPEAARQLFGESRMPTLAQYDPISRYFEAIDRTLIFSGDNGIPLIRYNILDTGGVIAYADMLAFLAGWGFDPIAELGGPQARGARDMPFVYVFGRSDFTVSFFGANIYPENITVGLEQPGVSGLVTGKFVLEVRETDDHNPFLSVVVELAPGAVGDPGSQALVSAAILEHLLRLNSEFRNYVPQAYQTPQVQLAPAGDPDYFPLGVKHRYTRRPRP
jgi:phenylacetate-CoA ligase